MHVGSFWGQPHHTHEAEEEVGDFVDRTEEESFEVVADAVVSLLERTHSETVGILT